MNINRTHVAALYVAGSVLVGIGAAMLWHTSRRPLPPADHRERETLSSSLGPALPRPELAPGYFPPVEDIALYRLQIGIKRGADDVDAEWLMAIATLHPDRDVRLGILSTFPMMFAENRTGEGKMSTVSRPWREQALSLLREHLSSPDPEARACAVSAICVGRLWKQPGIKEALLAMENDPNAQVQDLLTPCLPEARRDN